MKAEERHEIEQNELVKALAKVKSANARRIAIWVGVGLLIFGGVFFVRYMQHLTAGNDADRWMQLQSIFEKDKLKEFMEKNRGKEPGFIAKMRYARILLTEDGLQKLGTNDLKAEMSAANNVEEAKKLFLELTKELGSNQMLIQEAWMDAAKAEESLIGVPKLEDPNNEDAVKKLAAKLANKEESVPTRGDFDLAMTYLEAAALINPDSDASKKIRETIESKKKNKSKIVAFYNDLQRQFYTAAIPDKPGLKLDAKDTNIGPTLIEPPLKSDKPKTEDKAPELKLPDEKKEPEKKEPEKKEDQKKEPEKKIEPEKK